MGARGQVRRIGVNINQAIARLDQAAAALSDVARNDRVRPKS